MCTCGLIRALVMVFSPSVSLRAATPLLSLHSAHSPRRSPLTCVRIPVCARESLSHITASISGNKSYVLLCFFKRLFEAQCGVGLLAGGNSRVSNNQSCSWQWWRKYSFLIHISVTVLASNLPTSLTTNV